MKNENRDNLWLSINVEGHFRYFTTERNSRQVFQVSKVFEHKTGTLFTPYNGFQIAPKTYLSCMIPSVLCSKISVTDCVMLCVVSQIQISK